MKFTIEASATPSNKLLKEYPCLHNFDYSDEEKIAPYYEAIRDDNGIWITQLAGNKIKKTPTIIINDLNDLISLMQMTETPVILSIDKIEDPNCTDFTIELYNGYRE